MPNAIEPYTHRIGRTGRAGRKGTAVTFLTMSDTEVIIVSRLANGPLRAPRSRVVVCSFFLLFTNGNRADHVDFLAQVFYDLKRMLEASGVAVPHQLAQHEAAKNKPGAFGSRQEKPMY